VADPDLELSCKKIIERKFLSCLNPLIHSMALMECTQQQGVMKNGLYLWFAKFHIFNDTATAAVRILWFQPEV